jgi:hypothetical protein
MEFLSKKSLEFVEFVSKIGHTLRLFDSSTHSSTSNLWNFFQKNRQNLWIVNSKIGHTLSTSEDLRKGKTRLDRNGPNGAWR